MPWNSQTQAKYDELLSLEEGGTDVGKLGRRILDHYEDAFVIQDALDEDDADREGGGEGTLTDEQRGEFKAELEGYEMHGEAGGTGFGSSLMLGLTDEGNALSSVRHGDEIDYDTALQVERVGQDILQAASPGSFALGEAGGAVLGAAAMAPFAMAGAAGRAIQAGSRTGVGKVATFGGLSAAQEFPRDLGRAEGNLVDRGLEAGRSLPENFAFGVGATVAAPVIAAGVGGVAKAGKKVVDSFVGGRRVDGERLTSGTRNAENIAFREINKNYSPNSPVTTRVPPLTAERARMRELGGGDQQFMMEANNRLRNDALRRVVDRTPGYRTLTGAVRSRRDVNLIEDSWETAAHDMDVAAQQLDSATDTYNELMGNLLAKGSTAPIAGRRGASNRRAMKSVADAKAAAQSKADETADIEKYMEAIASGDPRVDLYSPQMTELVEETYKKFLRAERKSSKKPPNPKSQRDVVPAMDAYMLLNHPVGGAVFMAFRALGRRVGIATDPKAIDDAIAELYALTGKQRDEAIEVLRRLSEAPDYNAPAKAAIREIIRGFAASTDPDRE